MGEIIEASFSPKQTDGGKARILRRRAVAIVDRKYGASSIGGPPDLAIDHADPVDNGMPSDVAYCAPVWDPA